MRISRAGVAVRLAAAGSIIGACVALAACGDEAAKAPAAADTTAKPAAAASYPVTIENCGRTLTFDKAPSRAVVSYHPNVELFVSLGLADRAVGRTNPDKGEDPPALPGHDSIPVVANGFSPPPREKMLGLRSDFLLAFADFDLDEKQGLATLKQLNAADTNVYFVDCTETGQGQNTVETTYRALRDLGKIFGVSERAERVVKQMKDQIAMVQEKIAGRPPVRTFVYLGGEGPVDTFGGGGIDGQIIKLAGGVNARPDDATYFKAPLEKVAKQDVEAFVIIPGKGPTRAQDVPDATKEKRFLTKTFPNLEAIKKQRFAITAYIYTSFGPRQSKTVEDLARQLHPDAFGEPPTDEET